MDDIPLKETSGLGVITDSDIRSGDDILDIAHAFDVFVRINRIWIWPIPHIETSLFFSYRYVGHHII